ncbi:PD-(D/E)XK nuclease family protein [Aliarcobacter cryaerophilus]|uniref:PD-(D/E)XK nuclease family protein n=1 Tax=Aliarcobacter cryaerophilus TaxID=28198 RepID=UPI003DA36E8E
MLANLNKLEEMLKQMNTFRLSKSNDTYFDILGYGHYENINSNILSFYFSSNNGHNLYKYFIKSLFELLDIKEEFFTFSKTIREYTTLKGGRLDILIETDAFVIGIENKIYHHIHNDLIDYENTISRIAKKNNKKAVLCLLSLDKVSTRRIKNISHINLWNKIFEKIEFSKFILDKHIILLNEVKENIEFITKGRKMDIEQIRFLQNNTDNIKKLLELKDNFAKEQKSKCDKLKQEMDELFKKIIMKSGFGTVDDKKYFINDYIVYIEAEIDNTIIAIDMVLDIYQKWELFLFDRKNSIFTEKVKEILKRNNIDFKEEQYHGCLRAKIFETEKIDDIVIFLENFFKKLQVLN